MAQDAVTWDGGGVIARGVDQLAPAQVLQRGLDGAFRKPGRIRECAQTCRDQFPFIPRALAVKIQIDEVRGRLAIVPDDVAQQDVDDIVIDRDGFTEAWHVVWNNR
jgi:hypothetical protein